MGIAICDGRAISSSARRGISWQGSVIFYKNGPALEMDEKGLPFVKTTNPEDALLYMETELNSSMGDAGSWRDLCDGHGVAANTFIEATEDGHIRWSCFGFVSCDSFRNCFLLSGEFGVFVSGKLIARPYDRRGIAMETFRYKQ